jgi:hypothetical protein
LSISFNYDGNSHYGSFPGDPVGYLLTTTLSAGPAAAGDILILNAMGGVDGDGLGPMDVFDNLGSGGWTRFIDEQWSAGAPDTNTFHPVIAWKLCAGGETSVSIQFVDSSNKAMEVLHIADPSAQGFNDVYLLGYGGGAFNPGNGHIEFAAAPPGVITSDGEVYVGFTANARDGYTFANLLTNGGGADSGAGQSLSGAAYVIFHHWYQAGAGLTTDVEQYATNIINNPFMGVLGVRAGSPLVELAGDGPLALGGEGELTTTGGMTELSGAGGLALSGTGELSAESAELAGDGGFVLGGEGTLDVEGGGVNLQGDGPLVVGGTGRLTAILPNPPPGVPDLADTLGCGIYEAMIFTRGLGEIVGMVPFGQVDWTRVLDDVSTGQLTIDGVANRSQLQRCCRLLGEVNPWEHELAIYRSGYRVWSGPIISLTLPPNQVIINAFDLSAWLGARLLHDDYNAVQQDLADVWVAYVNDAMGVENSAGLEARVLALTGQLVDRLTLLTDHNVASDAIAELARTGLDWTTIDRVMQGGPLQPQPPPYAGASPYPTLIDESFRVQPTILVDGQQMGNAWSVNASGVATLYGRYGPHYPATPDHVESPAAVDYDAIEAQFGRIERLGQESRILDQASADANAQSRYELAKEPVAVISEGLLLPSAAIPMRKLIPGSIVNVHLVNCCKPIGAPYRVKAVRVTGRGDGSEDVTVEFQPVGTGTTLGA